MICGPRGVLGERSAPSDGWLPLVSSPTPGQHRDLGATPPGWLLFLVGVHLKQVETRPAQAVKPVLSWVLWASEGRRCGWRWGCSVSGPGWGRDGEAWDTGLCSSTGLTEGYPWQVPERWSHIPPHPVVSFHPKALASSVSRELLCSFPLTQPLPRRPGPGGCSSPA